MHPVISKQLEQGKLHHGYFLVGSSRICQRQIANIIDLLKITKADQIIFPQDQEVSIAMVRQLLSQIKFTPHSSLYKIIGLPAHRLGPQAAQALLKTLEEPPRQTIFFLYTPHERLVAPTVVSRCQRIYLGDYHLAEESVSFSQVIKLPVDKRFELVEQLAQSQNYSQAIDQWLVEVHNGEHSLNQLKIMKDMLELKKRLQDNVNVKLQLEAFFYNL